MFRCLALPFLMASLDINTLLRYQVSLLLCFDYDLLQWYLKDGSLEYLIKIMLLFDSIPTIIRAMSVYIQGYS